MIIGAQDPLEPSVALAAAQATRQLLAPPTVPAQAATSAPAQGIIADALTLSNLATDPFSSLLQQATTAPETPSTTPQAAAESPAVQVANQLQDLTTVGTTGAITQNTPLEDPDPQSALLRQATLAPLASQLAGGPAPGGTEAADQALRDVAAAAALSPAGAFGNNQTSTPNPYTLVQTQPAAAAYSGAGSAESYALMQQLLVPTNPTGSLDLLV